MEGANAALLDIDFGDWPAIGEPASLALALRARVVCSCLTVPVSAWLNHQPGRTLADLASARPKSPTCDLWQHGPSQSLKAESCGWPAPFRGASAQNSGARDADLPPGLWPRRGDRDVPVQRWPSLPVASLHSVLAAPLARPSLAALVGAQLGP